MAIIDTTATAVMGADADPHLYTATNTQGSRRWHERLRYPAADVDAYAYPCPDADSSTLGTKHTYSAAHTIRQRTRVSRAGVATLGVAAFGLIGRLRSYSYYYVAGHDLLRRAVMDADVDMLMPVPTPPAPTRTPMTAPMPALAPGLTAPTPVLSTLGGMAVGANARRRAEGYWHPRPQYGQYLCQCFDCTDASALTVVLAGWPWVPTPFGAPTRKGIRVRTCTDVVFALGMLS